MTVCFPLFFAASTLFEVAGSLQSKQNAGLSEQQQDYLLQTKVVDSAQDFTKKHTLGFFLM